jgi:hypothetical protein
MMFAVAFMLLLGMHTFFAIPWKLSLLQAPVFVPFSWTRGLGVGFALSWYLSGEQRSVRALLRRHGPLNLQVHAAMWQKLVFYVQRGLMALASAHAIGVAIASLVPSHCPLTRALVMRFAPHVELVFHCSGVAYDAAVRSAAHRIDVLRQKVVEERSPLELRNWPHDT